MPIIYFDSKNSGMLGSLNFNIDLNISSSDNI